MNLRGVETQPIVAIDADGTLVDFAQGVADYAYRVHRKVYDPQQIHPNPFKNDGDDDLLFDVIEELLEDPEEIANLKPYPGVIEGLHILCEEGYNPHLVSVREASRLEQATRKWTEIHNCLPYLSQLHLREGKDYGSEFKVKKAQELRVVAAFDDDEDVVCSYAAAGIRAVYIRNPYIPVFRKTQHPLVTQHPSFLLGVKAFVKG